MTTIRDALQAAKDRIATVSTSVSLDAQLLLAEVLQVSRAHVIAHREKVLTPQERQTYDALIQRRAQGEPVAYLLGRRAFYDREFIVSPAVLIPRPETELLVEQALDYLKAKPQATAIDVGTGSGAIAVAVTANIPQVTMVATDISTDALHIARMNAEAQGVNIRFLEGHLLQPVIEQGIQADLLLANLPYIATDEMPTLDVSRYEPHLALDGGADGLDLIREFMTQAAQCANPNALILLEIGADQGQATITLAEQYFPQAAVTLLKDYAHHDRVIRVQL